MTPTVRWVGTTTVVLSAIASVPELTMLNAADSTATGIVRVTVGPADLTVPDKVDDGDAFRYGLGFPFQVAPTLAGLFCNLRTEGKPVVDFENGTDVILFDDLARVSAEHAIPISRNEQSTDPETGAQRIAVKYPVIGGFVPSGALRADGSAHPHAGTGFGICQAISFPLDDRGCFSWGTERTHRLEVHQLAYDGKTFQARRQTKPADPAHPPVLGGPWEIVAPGITGAIPDGDDLLQPLLCYGGGASVSGVGRWQRSNGQWVPASFEPVAPKGESWSEASLVRDTDGALLFNARGSGKAGTCVRVWRRSPGATIWDVILSKEGARTNGPVSLNQALDGTPYIGACLLGHGRETLCLWPLGPERDDLLNGLVVRNAKGEFGPAASGRGWMVDHPSAAAVRLADGRWHHVVAYRILQHAEFAGKAPAPQSGCYLEEVISRGEPVMPWRFR